MLSGKIRKLPPNAPNPYPDTILAEVEAADTDEDCVALGQPVRPPKRGGSLLKQDKGRH